jgi:hypothetical protein
MPYNWIVQGDPPYFSTGLALLFPYIRKKSIPAVITTLSFFKLNPDPYVKYNHLNLKFLYNEKVPNASFR